VTDPTGPRADYPRVSDLEREVIETYGHLFNNTGGNDPLDLLNRFNEPGSTIARTNFVVFTLATAVHAQVLLIVTLVKKGLLPPLKNLEKTDAQ
jgi:hypothetical protein